MLYLMTNKEKLEEEHSRKYNTISKNKIVAVGKQYNKVKNINVKNLLVVYIPRKGEKAFLI